MKRIHSPTWMQVLIKLVLAFLFLSMLGTWISSINVPQYIRIHDKQIAGFVRTAQLILIVLAICYFKLSQGHLEVATVQADFDIWPDHPLRIDEPLPDHSRCSEENTKCEYLGDNLVVQVDGDTAFVPTYKRVNIVGEPKAHEKTYFLGVEKHCHILFRLTAWPQFKPYFPYLSKIWSKPEEVKLEYNFFLDPGDKSELIDVNHGALNANAAGITDEARIRLSHLLDAVGLNLDDVNNRAKKLGNYGTIRPKREMIYRKTGARIRITPTILSTAKPNVYDVVFAAVKVEANFQTQGYPPYDGKVRRFYGVTVELLPLVSKVERMNLTQFPGFIVTVLALLFYFPEKLVHFMLDWSWGRRAKQYQVQRPIVNNETSQLL